MSDEQSQGMAPADVEAALKAAKKRADAASKKADRAIAAAAKLRADISDLLKLRYRSIKAELPPRAHPYTWDLGAFSAVHPVLQSGSLYHVSAEHRPDDGVAVLRVSRAVTLAGFLIVT